MKKKICVTLSHNVLTRMDRLAGAKRSRSSLIERVLRQFLLERTRAIQQAHDLELINESSEYLNSEVADVLELLSKLNLTHTG